MNFFTEQNVSRLFYNVMKLLSLILCETAIFMIIIVTASTRGILTDWSVSFHIVRLLTFKKFKLHEIIRKFKNLFLKTTFGELKQLEG